MDGNEQQSNPDGKDPEATHRISFNASLDGECERDQDNARAAERNPNPVHALLEPEEIGKPGVLTLHFVENIGDRRSGSFRGAARQGSDPVHESDDQRNVERSSDETAEHDLRVVPMADESVREER